MLNDRCLRVTLIGLVTLNLVFVQLTGAASMSWLAPLYALTWLSPLLRPLIRSRLYRLGWNLAVLGVFGVLLRHATAEDLRFVLEDGLVLAGLCQVHLLNNLRAEQRTDLLFLNSILIAIVTGYLSQDLAYPLAFLAFVPFYVIGQQFQSLAQAGAALSSADARAVVRSGALLSCVLLVLSFAVFLVWPRDFDRPGFLSQSLDFDSGGGSEVDFADEMDPEAVGRARASRRVVFSVTVQEGRAANVPSLWRGTTLDSTDGRRWRSVSDSDLGSAASGDPRWRLSDGAYTRPGEAGGERVRVHVELASGAGPLFMPLMARHLEAVLGIDPTHIDTFQDGTAALAQKSGRAGRATYALELESEREPRLGGRTPERLQVGLLRYVALPRSSRLEAASALADELAAQLPSTAEQHELVARLERHLETTNAYIAPGEDGAAETLNDFVGGAPGHCELFASALASMLRSRGVPARVATGYRSREWDESATRLTVRARDAHAWVEVHDPQAGWYAVDPVPLRQVEAAEGVWASLHAKLTGLWAKVASFNKERRGLVLGWVRRLPAQSARFLRQHPLAVLSGGVLLGALLVLLRARRVRRTPAPVRHYRAALRRAGLEAGVGETPRELLARARREQLSRERLEALEAATAEHERARYAA